MGLCRKMTLSGLQRAALNGRCIIRSASRSACVLVSLWCLLGCLPHSNVGPGQAVEIVIPEGASLTAESNAGPVTVLAVTKFRRQYKWDHTLATFDLKPRTRRWYGGLGIGLGDLPSGHYGLSNIVLEEYQAHYHSTASVIKVVTASNTHDGAGFTNYWTSDGLWVLFHFEHAGGFLSLDASVTQFCVNGEKPKNLPGATPSLAIRDASGRRISSLPCVHVDESGYTDTWPKDKGFRD